MATATFRSDITADCYLEFSGASYTPDDGGSVGADGDYLNAYWRLSAGTYRADEVFFGFDLTDPTTGDAPTEGATITSVTLNMYLVEHGNLARTKDVYAYDWSTTVDTGDWRTVAQLQALYDSGDGLVADYDIPSGWGGDEGSHDFATGDGAIDAVTAAIGGTLRLIMVDAAHRAGSTPTGEGYCSWYSAGYATEANRPLLTVEYTQPSLPTLSTKTVTDITSSTATSGGIITDDGGETLLAYGVCWNTSGSPTLEDDYTDDS